MNGKLNWVVVLAVLAIAAGARAEDAGVEIQAIHQRVKDLLDRVEHLEQKEQQRKALDGESRQVLEEMKRVAKAADRAAQASWLEDLTFYGDFRFRYEWLCYGSHERPYSKKDRQRLRMRLRFGLLKTWLDEQIEVNFRLATGSSEYTLSPERVAAGTETIRLEGPITSGNQTLEGAFSKKPIWVDLAYGAFRPKILPGLAVILGKMKNPFRTSWLFIDTDVNPEGIWAEWVCRDLGPITPFVGAGAFSLEEVDQAGNDAYDTVMMGYLAGADLALPGGAKLTIAGNVWDYDHYDSAVAGRVVGAGGNTDTAYDFLVLALHAKASAAILHLPVALTADWAHNCRANGARAGGDDEACAFAVGATVGTNKKAGDWSVGYTWARLADNALPGALADAEFGGTGRRGHVIKAKYSITKFLTAGGALYVVEPISPRGGQDETVRLQLDLLWAF